MNWRDKLIEKTQAWGARNPETVERIEAWADSVSDNPLMRGVEAVGAGAYMLVKDLGKDEEKERLYNQAYNAGLKGTERAAAIKAYLEYGE